jgi:hypothetical protein
VTCVVARDQAISPQALHELLAVMMAHRGGWLIAHRIHDSDCVGLTSEFMDLALGRPVEGFCFVAFSQVTASVLAAEDKGDDACGLAWAAAHG